MYCETIKLREDCTINILILIDNYWYKDYWILELEEEENSLRGRKIA